MGTPSISPQSFVGGYNKGRYAWLDGWHVVKGNLVMHCRESKSWSLYSKCAAPLDSPMHVGWQMQLRLVYA